MNRHHNLRAVLLSVLLPLCTSIANPQRLTPNPATQLPTLDGTTCCGPITPAGQRLIQVLDGMHVEKLWPAQMRVDWKTGEPLGPSTSEGKNSHTHCSAFAAAVGQRLGVYMLRPPEHSQILLASAQGQWFTSAPARAEGWRPVTTLQQAQTLANQGQLVVIVFINPDPERSGHIALVRPAIKSSGQLAKEGPQTSQAGFTNFSSGTAVHSFHSHPGAWPTQVQMFAHPVSF